MKNLAIIPARSGSKGLKDKNIRTLDGKPMIAYTILAAIKSDIFDEVFVSTDSMNYADISRNFGAKVEFLRSTENSLDSATTWAVVDEVINNYKDLYGLEFDMVTILQPTSPLRDNDDLIKAYKLFHSLEADSIVSVCESDHSPLLQNTLPPDRSLYGFLDRQRILSRRQLLDPFYRINGAIYMFRVSSYRLNKTIYTEKSFALIMDKFKSIDIDDEYDFFIAECILKRKGLR